MKAISDNLIHFLGREFKDSPNRQLGIFKSIIETGLRLSNIETVFGATGLVLNQGVCFTDIPLNFCDDQAAVYGKFGIGFKRSFVKRVGGNPVRYFVDYEITGKPTAEIIETRGLLFSLLKGLLATTLKVDEHLKAGMEGYYNKTGDIVFTKEEMTNFKDYMLQIYSFEKEVGDLGPARDDTEDCDIYYAEREWRIVGSKAMAISGKVVQRDGQNYVPFRCKDVRIVIVPNEDIKKNVVEYFLNFQNNIDTRLAEYAKYTPSILTYDELKYF